MPSNVPSRLIYTSTIFQVLAFAGLVIKMFFPASTTLDGTQGPASSNIWGYGLVLIGLFGLTFIQFAFENKDAAAVDPSNKSVADLAKSTWDGLLAAFPTFAVIIALLWLIILNSKYYTQINKGDVSSEYNQFSTASTILVLLQLLLVGKELNEAGAVIKDAGSQKNIAEEVKVSQTSHYAGLLAAISIIFVMMQNIVLEYYTVDG